MSDMAKAARAAMKAKAKNLTSSGGDPKTKVDSSTWTPAEPLNTEVKTGLRPVSRRAFKTGGKVMGVKAKANMGKKARASGGKAMTADSMINRNVKEANEERSGLKHVGGMKKGGRAHKNGGGWFSDSIDRLKESVGLGPKSKSSPFTNEESKEHYQALRENRPSEMDRKKLADMAAAATDTRSNQEAQRKRGGRTKKDIGGMLGGPMGGLIPMAMNAMRDKDEKKNGGRTKKEIGGPLSGAKKMLDRSVQQAGVPSSTMSFGKIQKGDLSPMKAAGLKKGGAAHDDVKEDKALIRKMVKPSARMGKEGGGAGMPKKGSADDIERGLARNLLARSMAESKLRDAGKNRLSDISENMGYATHTEPHEFPKLLYPGAGLKKGGRAKRADGGGMRSESTQMAKAKSDLRSAYDDAKPSYNPIKNIGDIVSGRAMEKGASLSNALDRSKSAEQETGGYKKGGRTKRATGGGVFSGPGYPGKVPGATGGRTAHARGGKAGKGKTDINIVIAAGKPAGAGDMMPGGPTPPPPRPVPVPPPAAGGPPPAGMPMQMPPMPPQGGAGGPPMAGGMPPMPRKAGGRITKIARSYKDMEAGAGSGEGRLQKTDIAKRTMHNKGGKVGHRNYRNYEDMDAGAGSGFGRLEKTEMARKKTGIQLA